MRRILRFSGLLLLAYVTIVAVLLLARRDMIYAFSDFPANVADVPRAEARIIPGAGDMPPLEVWIAPPLNGRPVILYFMGNAGNLALNAPRLKEFTQQGYGIAAMTYRGGGGRPGRPSEAALLADARRLYDSLDDLIGEPVGPEKRVIYGSSLGTGIATALAVEVGEMAVILESPFTRMCDLAAIRYPFVPACMIMWDEHFDNLDRIGRIGAPLLVLHGTADGVVPYQLGTTLYEAAAEPKMMRSYEGGHHNDLRLYGAGPDTMAFLDGL